MLDADLKHLAEGLGCGGSPVNTNTMIIALPDLGQLPALTSCISPILYLDPALDLEILPESPGSTWCLFLDSGLFGKLMVGQRPPPPAPAQ